MDNQSIFNELFHQLTVEQQQELLSLLKDIQKSDKGKKKERDSFSGIDYRDLYQTLFFEVGRHVDSLINVLHQLEEIHLKNPKPGQVINLHTEDK
jgi:hypothetical protein